MFMFKIIFKSEYESKLQTDTYRDNCVTLLFFTLHIVQ